VQIRTATYNPSLHDFTDAAIALGIVIALGVLAAPTARPGERSPPLPRPRSACSAPSSAWPAR